MDVIEVFKSNLNEKNKQTRNKQKKKGNKALSSMYRQYSNMKKQTASLTNGSVSSGLILAVDCHTQKGMGTRRMFIHISDGGSPVRLSHGKHLSINQSVNQSIDQSINQSIKQSISQLIT